jgi:hypothetical protein
MADQFTPPEDAGAWLEACAAAVRAAACGLTGPRRGAGGAGMEVL